MLQADLQHPPRDGNDPSTCPEVVEEDFSEGDQLAPRDRLDKISEYAYSDYILGAFFSVSTGEFDVD